MNSIHVKTKFVDTVINLDKALLVTVGLSGIQLLYCSGKVQTYPDIEEAYLLPGILTGAGFEQVNETDYLLPVNLLEARVFGSLPPDPNEDVILELLTDTDSLDEYTVVVKAQKYLDLVASSVTLS